MRWSSRGACRPRAGAGTDRRAGGAARGRRRPRPGAHPLLGPARAPPSRQPRQPARGARRVRRPGRRHGAERLATMRRRLRALDRALGGARARREAAERDAPTWRSWWRRSTTPASTPRRRRPCWPSASGCATRRAWRPPPLPPPRRCRPRTTRGAGAVAAVGGAARALEPLIGRRPRARGAPRRPDRRRGLLQEAAPRCAYLAGPRRRARTAGPGRGAARGLCAPDPPPRPGTAEVIARADAAREALRVGSTRARERSSPSPRSARRSWTRRWASRPSCARPGPRPRRGWPRPSATSSPTGHGPGRAADRARRGRRRAAGRLVRDLAPGEPRAARGPTRGDGLRRQSCPGCCWR